jgi:phenylacetate-coenzyme A ligase PaaK-like adenylate-forming protein
MTSGPDFLPLGHGLPGSSSWEALEFQTKEQLRTRRYDLPATSDVLYWFSSSGSTGDPVVYPWTAADQRIADLTVRKAQAGLEPMPGATGFVIAPTGLPSMWYHMDRQLHSLGLTTVFPGVAPERILALMERLRPRLLISLPLVLSRLGEFYATAAGRPLSDGLLFAGGDVLSSGRRGRIEALWDMPLKNFYGISEVFGPLASESGDAGSFSWQAEEVFVEVIDPVTRRQVDSGETGVAVLTTLWHRPASLVRYWTGDCFRLLGWLAPGRPLFTVRGREQVRLPGLKPEFFPVDVDDVVLSDPAAGNEWSLTDRGRGLLLTVETESRLDALDPQTLAGVEEMFDRPVDWQATPPGTLDRSIPKLAVSGLQV